jgi:hypothetical protein
MTLSTFFYGSRVRLTPLTPNDVPTLARWQTDTEYLRLLAAEPAFPKNEGQVGEWVREGQRGRDNFLLGIRTIGDDDLIRHRHRRTGLLGARLWLRSDDAGAGFRLQRIKFAPDSTDGL